MIPKQDQQRVKSLLTDAITIMCKSGLPYKSEFCIEGLLGITLDNHDIFLINIKETIRNASLSGSSPNGKDPLVPLDLMVLNSVSLSDVQSTLGENLSLKNTAVTSTPGKKHNTSISSYLDKIDGSDKNELHFALNYANYDMIEDLSRAGCGKRLQGLTMDDLAVLDNDMGVIMEKDDVSAEATDSDKMGDLKTEALGCLPGMEPIYQTQTLDLSVQDVISITASSEPDNIVFDSCETTQGEGEMPLNLSEPKKKKPARVSNVINRF